MTDAGVIDSGLLRGESLPTPTPAAGLAAYLAERERALASCPRKRANYQRYLASERRSAEVDYLPIRLDIENVSRCNLRCTMCTVSDWTKGIRAGDMSLAAFERLLEEQYGLVEIKLQGIGEPLLQGEEFLGMIRAARRRHIWVRTTTNATLLHLKDNYARLVDAGTNEIQVSIDGATAATYEGIRRGAKFDRVIDNCRRLNEYCREQGVDLTKMWTVVQTPNVGELEAIVDLAAAAGFKSMVFSLSMSDWGLETWRERNHAGVPEDGVSFERLARLVERGARAGTEVAYWQVAERYSTAEPERLCPWPFERAYIASDMRVVPCCYVGNPDVLQIDEPIAEGRSFADIWQGEAFAAFRRRHLEGALPAVCRNCYHAEAAPVPASSRR